MANVAAIHVDDVHSKSDATNSPKRLADQRGIDIDETRTFRVVTGQLAAADYSASVYSNDLCEALERLGVKL